LAFSHWVLRRLIARALPMMSIPVFFLN
jgi:hypothetical protein